MDKVQTVHKTSAGLCVLAFLFEILGYTCPGWLLVTTDLSILSLGTSLTGFGQVSSRAGVWYVDVCVNGDSSQTCTHSSEHEPRQMGFKLSPVFAAVSDIDWKAVQTVLTMALLFCGVGALFSFLGLCSLKAIASRTSTMIAAAGMTLSGIFVLPALVIVGTAMNNSKDKANAIKETTGEQFVKFEVPWALVLSAFGLVTSFVCSAILIFITYLHHGKEKEFSSQYGNWVPPAIITSGKFPANIARVRMSVDDEIAPPVFKKLRGYVEEADESTEQNEENEEADSKPFVHPPPSQNVVDGQNFHVGQVPLLPFKVPKTPKAESNTSDEEMPHSVTEENKRVSDIKTDAIKTETAILTKSKQTNINKDVHSSNKSPRNNQTTNRPVSSQKFNRPTPSRTAAPNTKEDTPKIQQLKSNVKLQNVPTLYNSKKVQGNETSASTKTVQAGDIHKAQQQPKQSNKETPVMTAKVVPPKPFQPKAAPSYAKLTQSQLIKLEAKHITNAEKTQDSESTAKIQNRKSPDTASYPSKKNEQAHRPAKKSILGIISSPIKHIVSRNTNTLADRVKTKPDPPKQTEHTKGNNQKKGHSDKAEPNNKKVKHTIGKVKSKKKHPTHATDQSASGNVKKKKKVHKKIKRRHRTHNKKHKHEKDESHDEYESDSGSEEENPDVVVETATVSLSDHPKTPVTITVTECKSSAHNKTNYDHPSDEKMVETNEKILGERGLTKTKQEHELTIPDNTNKYANEQPEIANVINGNTAKQEHILADTNENDGESGQSVPLDNNGDSYTLVSDKENGNNGLPRISPETDSKRSVSFERQSSDTSSANTRSSDRKNSDTVLTGHV